MIAAQGKRIAITARRDLTPQLAAKIRTTMYELVQGGAKALVFGGARGGDTIALIAAYEAKVALNSNVTLLVIVPGTVDEQPPEARLAIRQCASAVIEMRQNLSHYASRQNRNLRQLAKSDFLVAFWDGKRSGGTWNCIAAAETAEMEVVKIV